MMTFKVVLGVMLIALYLLALAMVVMLGLELKQSRRRGSGQLRVGAKARTNEGTNIHQGFTAEDDMDGEGARPSSLIPYYHHKPDRAYLMQLKYAVEKANEETLRKFGPLPSDGLPVQKKAKLEVPYRDFQGNLEPEVSPINEESDEMKFGPVAVTAVSLAAGTGVACNANQPAPVSTFKEAATYVTHETPADSGQHVPSYVSPLVSVKDAGVTIRTESYPRPPSSGATYYIYEKDGKVICTKLAVCDKYGNCKSEYRVGTYKAEQDVEVGQAYSSTQPEPIARDKLSKHVCLARYVKDPP